jgi:hypothetical protein
VRAIRKFCPDNLEHGQDAQSLAVLFAPLTVE